MCRIARITLGCFTGRVLGAGKQVVPSRPVEPEHESVLDWHRSSYKLHHRLTVYIRSVHRFSTEGLCSSWMDWNIRSACSDEDTQSVGGGMFDRGIAVDGAYAEKGQIRILGGKKDGKGVL